MRDIGLADRIRARSVPVVEVAGWQTRGSSAFRPQGTVNHHTAGAASGAVPSLAICTYGRPDLAGPLCNVLLGRDLVAYVIAAGRANHAGPGGWRNLIGNTSVHGLEIEHTGHGPSHEQLRVAIQIHAAMLEAPGSSGDADLVCQHFEWAPRRKIDFRDLAPYTPNSFRAAIAAVLIDPLEDPAMAQWIRDIKDAYAVFLLRNPTVGELRGWLSTAKQQGGTDGIVEWIANSDEAKGNDSRPSGSVAA